MKQPLLRCVVALVIFVGLASTAEADSVRIVDGGLSWSRSDGTVAISLLGEGFTFAGGTHPSAGIFAPWNQCNLPECTAGTTVDLLARFLGNDMPGTAAFQGTTYTGVGGLGPDAAQMLVEFTGSATLPAMFGGGVVTAPFQFTGVFSYPQGPFFELTNVDLFGQGTASLTFAPWGPAFPGAFILDSARYQFDAAAPVPEPTSMILIGTGLAGLVAVRRRQRRLPAAC